MRILHIKVSETCDRFISELQKKSGYASPEAGLRAPIAPLSQTGRGAFFVGYREYTEFDDSRLIDWRASIRSNKTLIKKFEIRKTLDIMFVLDVSASMMFGSTDKLKSEYAAELVASLSYSALQFGNNVGVIMFSDKIVGETRMDSGEGQHTLILNKMSNINLYGGGYNIEAPLKYLEGILKQNTLIIIVSDFLGLGKNWKDLLGMLSANFNIVGIMIRDPIDYSLKSLSGNFAFSGVNNSDKKVVIDKKIKKFYENIAKKRAKEIETNFRLSNAYFLSLTTDKDFIDELSIEGGD